MSDKETTVVMASDIKDAFNNGLKTAEHKILEGGLVLHHKDLNLSDKSTHSNNH